MSPLGSPVLAGPSVDILSMCHFVQTFHVADCLRAQLVNQRSLSSLGELSCQVWGVIFFGTSLEIVHWLGHICLAEILGYEVAQVARKTCNDEALDCLGWLTGATWARIPRFHCSAPSFSSPKVRLVAHAHPENNGTRHGCAAYAYNNRAA